jgi:hypothetical protein
VKSLVNMETKQNTLDGFVKSQKRPTNDDNMYKISKINSTNRTGIVKSSRKLSFDSSSSQTIKKQKVGLIYFNNLQFKL